MTRRSLALLAAALAGTVALTPAAAATASFGITEAGGTVFPDRAYVLSLPKVMKLKSDQVRVEENANRVGGVSVIPAERARSEDFGAVLVIDASLSMRGKPEFAALEAARAFAAQRKPNQQFGIVTFNKTPTVMLPLTTDALQIEHALAKPPPLALGTHIYDAVDSAIGMLRQARIGVGSVIVLSDGADTGSAATRAGVTSAARLGHVRIFSVGLHSRFFEKTALERLASEGRGSYAEAESVGELTPIYNELGSQLASEYLIRYKSLAGPGKQIRVVVHVAGLDGAAQTAYKTPALDIIRTPKAPYEPSALDRIWRSVGTMFLIILLTGVLVGVGAVSIISGPRQGTLRRRMAEFVSVPTAASASRQRPTAQLTDKLLEGTESLLKGSSWWQRFKWELRVAEVGLPAEQIAILTILGTIVMFVVVKFLSGSILIGIVLAAAVPYIARWYLKRSLLRRRAQFAEQLPDNLQVLSSALRAGHSFVGALSVVVNDAPEPAKSEFSRVVADEQLGVPIEDALRVVVERMDNRELEQVALVAALQRETGGNTAEVLDRVTDTIRERFELRRTVQTLTAQGRMSRWVLTFLPIALLLVITLINPGYIDIMYSSLVGRILLVMAGISVTAGSFVIKRIVNIKV